MPDPIVAADASPAPSSGAVESSPAEPVDQLASLSETELHTWRMDGTLPSSAPVPDAAAASSTAEPVVQAASTDASIVAASEPAAAPAKGAEARIPELLSDRAKERERADRAEQRIRELEARQSQPPPDARPAASSAAPAGLVKPDPETFPYGTADPAYLEALTDYKVAATLATKQAEWDDGQRQARARDEQQRVLDGFERRVEAARAVHPPDLIAVALGPTEIPQGSAMDLFILEDPAGAEVLVHLQQPANAGERRRILKLGPLDQLKELVRLGDRLAAGPAAPRSTNAPAPAPVLSTRATPVDPVERAIRDDDTAAYNREMNARDLARLNQR